MGAISDPERLRETIAAVQKQAAVFKDVVAAATASKARMESASGKAEGALRELASATKDALAATERLRSVQTQWTSLKAEIERQADVTFRDRAKSLADGEARIRALEVRWHGQLDAAVTSAQTELQTLRDMSALMVKECEERLRGALDAEIANSRTKLEESTTTCRESATACLREVEALRKAAEEALAQERKEGARRQDAAEDFLRGRLADYQSAFQPLRDASEGLRVEQDRLAQEARLADVRVSELVGALGNTKAALEAQVALGAKAQEKASTAMANRLLTSEKRVRVLTIATLIAGVLAVVALLWK